MAVQEPVNNNAKREITPPPSPSNDKEPPSPREEYSGEECNRLIMENLELISSQMKRYANRHGMELDELWGQAYLAFLECLREYDRIQDGGRYNGFTDFLRRSFYHKLQDECRREHPFSRQARRIVNTFHRGINEIQQARGSGVDPMDETVLGYVAERVCRRKSSNQPPTGSIGIDWHIVQLLVCQRDRLNSHSPFSIFPQGDGEEGASFDNAHSTGDFAFTLATNTGSPETQAVNKTTIEEILKVLPPLAQNIMRKHFFEDLSLTEIGRKMTPPRSEYRMSQIYRYSKGVIQTICGIRKKLSVYKNLGHYERLWPQKVYAIIQAIINPNCTYTSLCAALGKSPSVHPLLKVIKYIDQLTDYYLNENNKALLDALMELDMETHVMAYYFLTRICSVPQAQAFLLIKGKVPPVPQVFSRQKKEELRQLESMACGISRQL